MKGIISKARVPIKFWTDVHEVESPAIDQLVNTANLPCVFKHVAVMPDVHLGKGATVGSVVATARAVVPAAVGVDIGCGMMAAQLPFKADRLPDSLKTLRDEIEWSVPVGFSQHKTPRPESDDWAGWASFDLLPEKLLALNAKAACQIGTLGGGNHFIEVCLDTDQNVWIMLHSGSRNIGKELAEYHIKEAKGLMRKYLIDLPDPDLAYLVEGTNEFESYWHDLQWAQSYAMKNREVMMAAVLKAVAKVVYGDWKKWRDQEMETLTVVNCHHNYAEREHHFGQDVIVTRKGAVRARVGDMGIIPGSMGARSYIVRGKGNPESFCSCSHGAGRRYSRSEAKRRFTVEDLSRATEGVECRKDAGVLDEIPLCYKPIEQVMANQEDLVEIVAELKQVLCIKG
jgi:tRNA-splicing ligase RtcB